jgi:hypothetical protein
LAVGGAAARVPPIKAELREINLVAEEANQGLSPTTFDENSLHFAGWQ